MTRPTPMFPFTIAIGFFGERIDVRVAGSLDTVTGPLLLSELAHLADQGHTLVTLDLAGVDLVDAAGARAVAYMAARMRWVRSRLTVRSASPQARGVLRFGGLDNLIEYEGGAHVGRRALVDATVGADPLSATELVMAKFGPREHSFAVADAALRFVTTLAQATIPGADGVSVSLDRHGALMTVAASDDRIAQMDHDQYATGEGPCITAATEGSVVRVPSVASETRWPDFVPRARIAGIASILSSPLHAASGPIGALNMYSRTPRAFGANEVGLASLIAEQASGILIEAEEGPYGSNLGARLQTALHSRNLIALAQGVLIARTGDSAEQAYARLKLDARRTGRSVREVCEATIASAMQPDDVDSSPNG
ncbi:MAG TPA: GAF domain-containing protein [Acidimicrobiales bacterium]|nr:GAF domain-containing protein [Acidimicrobiales bacterium]